MSMDCKEQDALVRKAIDTDRLLTKELVLRKRFLEQVPHIPRLRDFPYVVDVEYLCFEETESPYARTWQLRAGQGDLLLTDGRGSFVAVEIKSCFVCFNGSDRIFVNKMAKLIEQVQAYTAYQRCIRPKALAIYGCGVTEQKIYWLENGAFEEFWWSSGPSLLFNQLDTLNIGERGGAIPDPLLEMHSEFLEEGIARIYPKLVDWRQDPDILTYTSKCGQKRMSVCRNHIDQKRIEQIADDYREKGCAGGHILMFGMSRPTLLHVCIESGTCL
jgi:Holliday junction resolvase-like predicted endonuclease